LKSDKIAAISLETGAVVIDEDVYATVKRPEGQGKRNELKKSHVMEALGISPKEYEQMLVRRLQGWPLTS
jgi:hypothetical protein